MVPQPQFDFFIKLGLGRVSSSTEPPRTKNLLVRGWENRGVFSKQISPGYYKSIERS
jgi:hypothetical protein